MEQTEKNSHIKIFVIIIFFFSLFVSSKDYFKKSGENKNKYNQNQKAETYFLDSAADNQKQTEESGIYGGDEAIENIKGIFPAADDVKNSKAARKMVKKEIDVQNFITGSKSRDFINLPVEAQGVYVYDLKNQKEIFGKNAENKFPLASLTKLMTAVVAAENLEEGEIIEISKNAVSEYGESNLSAGEKWRLNDLTDIMLVSSLNDAAAAISEKIEAVYGRKITDFMNKKARELDMNKTVFYNSTGLDMGKSAGAYGTAKDISILMEYILNYHPRLFLKTREMLISASMIGGENKNFANTNIYADKLKNLAGGKTGFTELSGGNLSFIFDAGGGAYYSVVIFKSSFGGRFKDALIIQDKILNNL